MIQHLLSKNATRKFYDVKEATDILARYGIAHNEKKTRDLIAKGKLAAKPRGQNPLDRRSGYEVSEKAIYDLVVSEIPILKEIFSELEKNKYQGTSTKPAAK